MNTEIGKNKVTLMIELHNEILNSAKTTISKAIELGAMLKEVKKELGHGQFTEWIKNNMPFTDRTARNYMNLSENQKLLESESVSVLNSAYKLLWQSSESSLRNDNFIDELVLMNQKIINDGDLNVLNHWIKLLKELLQDYAGLLLDCETRIGELLRID